MKDRFDVAVIGGGVIGLSIARELQRRGAGNIVVVERGRPGREASFAAAGMLAPDIEAGEGDEFYRLCRESMMLYPSFADELATETGVNIELDRSGTLFVAASDDEEKELIRKQERCEKNGINADYLNAEDVIDLEPEITSKVRKGLFFPNDWQVENRKLLEALRKFCDLNSITVREGSTVSGLRTKPNGNVNVQLGNDEIEAETTILATGSWTSFIRIDDSPVPVNVKPIRGQMICFHPETPMLKCVVQNASAYIVPRHDGRILVGATVEDVGFEDRTTADAIERLRKAAVELVPRLSEFEIYDSWSGLRPYGNGGLPVIGLIAGNIFVATAHYRNGILLAPITAKIVAEKIADGIDSPYLEIFGPTANNSFGTSQPGRAANI